MSGLNIFVTLLPDRYNYANPEDKMWQEECEELYLNIRKKIPGPSNIKPIQKRDSEDTRGADLFYIWSVSLVSISSFKIFYELLKLWVENRNQNKERVSAIINIGNNEINISNISKEEAITLCKRYITEGQTENKS